MIKAAFPPLPAGSSEHAIQKPLNLSSRNKQLAITYTFIHVLHVIEIQRYDID